MEISTYEFSVKAADGSEFRLSKLKGKVTLIVNVASKCGFTPQYSGLEELYRKYKDRGFMVLGFPCDQFGGQEPGSAEEIQNFCRLNYGVTFPVLGKIDVNGDDANPVYAHLKDKAPGPAGGEAIKWNFTKFLVDKKGGVIGRYASPVKPEDLSTDIEKALGRS